ncbi:MAG: hypothetical protein JSS82_18205 [Bacteroidetes bacterium]|nr:hypothetical protein [Bacteroidota bacterium]
MLLSPKNTRYASIALLVFVSVLLLLNVFTPLRINTDVARYLNIMEYLQGKLGADSFAATDFYPHGYPRLLSLLSACGMLNVKVLVVINMLSVLLAAYLFTQLFPVRNKHLFIALVLLSFVNIKHITLPVADELFTFVLLLATLLAKKGFDRNYAWFLPALLLALLSMYLRTAGIEFFGGLLFYLVYLFVARYKSHKYFRLIASVTTLGVLAGLVMVIVVLQYKSSYLQQLMPEGPYARHYISKRLGYHFRELGEVLVNLPSSQLAGRLHSNLVNYFFIMVGALVLLRMVSVAAAGKLFKRVPVWVVLCYVAMVLLWPFYDTRFMIPLIPFVLYVVFPQLREGGDARYVHKGVMVLFVLTGFLSMAYSDALSLSKNRFLKSYGNEPKLTRAYQLHFDKQNVGQQSAAHDDRDSLRMLYLLDTYDH